jgi:hypothetical protein
MPNMANKFGEDDFDDDSVNLKETDEDYRELFREKKKELLLDNRRARVTTMSFHDWFVHTYKRDYKPSDKPISEAYHSGASDEIDNNEYILEHTELKMNHYKNKAIKLADDLQILYSILDSVSKKADIPPALKKLVIKTLRDLS